MRNSALRMVALAVLSLASSSHAAIIIGNLSDSQSGATPSSLYNASSKGLRFTPTSSFTVTGLTLTLRDQNTIAGNGQSPNTLDVVTAKLYVATNSGTYLGAEAGAFTAINGSTTIAATGTQYAFAPNATFSVAMNTSYFLVVAGTTNGNNRVFQWLASTSTPTSVNATFNGARFGTPAAGLTGGTSSNNNLFELRGTAVPEPTAAVLACVAGGSALLRRRRREERTR